MPQTFFNQGAFPRTVGELAGFELYANCGTCGKRSMKVYPFLKLDPKLPLLDLLRRLTCDGGKGWRRCGGKPTELRLTLAGRNVPGDRHQFTPEWILDASGEWTEQPGEFWQNSTGE